MSLTVKHLNADASFLLTFQPVLPFAPSSLQRTNAFTILLDPWLSGPSKIWHSKFSVATHRAPSCISSLFEIPEPDVVVISQDKADHCHESTLKQLPGYGGKTIIVADASAAKRIRSWRHFDESKVFSLKSWEDPRHRRASNIFRIPLAPITDSGAVGEVTIALLTQKPDMTGLHSAIGITYRPPTFDRPFGLMSPPLSPDSFKTTFSHSLTDRAMSVLYSPHGCNYKSIAPYASSHLVEEAALPLTVLLHCFDRVSNPWYMGGNICAGFPIGKEIAENLCAKTWISAHDEEKEVKGLATLKTVIQKYEREKVESVISPRSEKYFVRRMGTEAVVLKSGEEITLSQILDVRLGFRHGDGDETPTNDQSIC